MSDTVIRVEGLSKLYRIGQRERYYALRDVLSRAISAPVKGIRQVSSSIFNSLSSEPRPSSSIFHLQSSSNPRSSILNPPSPAESGTIWALKDVSFEVRRGQVVGIIGRNGAGKTTLLKVLSKITEPTEGYAEIRGRMGSLLEVGTGFHPELSGRENIYLNGAILGMKRIEISRKFDEIVAFAEIEKFIDTPVKHYSSGMYVRLAFAVAAHLEPEILLVDEVLAVGDMSFQKKCLGKMGDVAKEGRTVLFVSHNIVAVQRLCSQGVLLQSGILLYKGSVHECLRRYSLLLESNLDTHVATSSDGLILIRKVRILDHLRRETKFWKYGYPITVEVEFELMLSFKRVAVDIAFYTIDRHKLFALQSDKLVTWNSDKTGTHKIAFHIENPGLSLPEVSLDVGIRTTSSAYDALSTFAALIYVMQDGLPPYAYSENLITPTARISWS